MKVREVEDNPIELTRLLAGTLQLMVRLGIEVMGDMLKEVPKEESVGRIMKEEVPKILQHFKIDKETIN